MGIRLSTYDVAAWERSDMCGWGRGGWGLEARAKVVSEAAHVSERHARCAMYRIHGGVPQSSPKYTVG
eukprot:scaffold101770_cov28-Tisochrysis_lutea.AAC.1